MNAAYQDLVLDRPLCLLGSTGAVVGLVHGYLDDLLGDARIASVNFEQKRTELVVEFALKL
jgi:hypothetical protein